MLETLFHQDARQIARETGFVQRQSPIGGEEFASTLVFGFLDNADASYTDLRQVLACQQVLVSSQAIAQRMTEPASELMRRLLERLLDTAMVGERCHLPVLSRFSGVYVQDGTMISLPSALRQHYQGCGGGKEAGEACVRIQVRYDLQQGQLIGPFLQDGKADEQDGAASFAQLAPPSGSLMITDSKYFTQEDMRTFRAHDRYFLTSYHLASKFCDERGVKWDVPTYLSVAEKNGQTRIDVPIRLGLHRQVPCRLIAVRKAEGVKRPRRVSIRVKGCRHDVQVGRKKEFKGNRGRKNHRVSLARTQTKQWVIMITNATVAQLTAEQAHALMRARWQIELLWKLWKQDGLLDIWRSEKPYRVLCEVYAKLLGLLIQHWLSILGCWDNPHRSLVQSAHAFQKLALSFVIALNGGMSWHELFLRNQYMMRNNRLNPRKKRPNTSQYLEAVS
jgi:hypothetical protein